MNQKIAEKMPETKPNNFFYGWIIVVIALLALIVSNGLAINGIPVFYKSVQNDLVSAGAVAPDKIQSIYGLAPALTTLLSGFLAPVAGFLLQKYNERKMMIFGCLILGSGLVVYSQANSPLVVYLAHALLGVSLGFVGVLVSSVLISNWFDKKRGTALGIILMGTSFGGFLFPLIAAPLIQNYGWRTAMISVSLIVWIVLLPAVIFLVKNHPSEIGLFPDGEMRIKSTEDKLVTGKQQSKNGMSLTEALGTPLFWIFSVCAALIFYAIYVVSQQLNLYLQSPLIGFTPAQASGVQSLLFGLSVIGKFLFGWLADRFPANRIMLISAATMFLATLCFIKLNGQTAYLFAVVFGLNYGGTFVLLQLLIVEYFGLKEYAKILGAITVIETAGGALGTFITGIIADARGGYAEAFYGVIIVAGLALILIVVLNLFLNKFRRPIWILPVFLTPFVGASVGLIVAPVLTEIIKVVSGAEINLKILVIVVFSLIGLTLGILAGKNLKVEILLTNSNN